MTRAFPRLDLIFPFLPMLAGVRGLGEAYTSPNGVPGNLTRQATATDAGQVQYSGSVLGLPFDVFMSVGQPVYGPSVPPPGTVQTAPFVYNGTFGHDDTPRPIDSPRPVVAYNPGNTVITLPPADHAAPPPPDQSGPDPAIDPNAGLALVGKATGDVFSFDLPQGIQDLLTRAGKLAPWYVWLGSGAAVVLLAAILLHHKTTRRVRR